MFVDVHSHVVPSGDDGAQSLAEGLALCETAVAHGTGVLVATPHVWPEQGLSRAREARVREAHARLRAESAAFGLDLRLGFELTPSRALLEDDPERYRLGELPFVLMELPFDGGLELALLLAEHIEAAGLTPIVAHPERAAAVHENPGAVSTFAERWPLQVNGSSLLGRHGRTCEELGWRFLDEVPSALVASDGHRTTRPAVLDAAYDAVRARAGEERALRLFDGSALGLAWGRARQGGGGVVGLLSARDGLDVAQGRQPV